MSKDHDDAPIQVDGYKIKVRVTTGAREEQPRFWGEVKERVNGSLMTLARCA